MQDELSEKNYSLQATLVTIWCLQPVSSDVMHELYSTQMIDIVKKSVLRKR
jgi:hypothetical protein